MNDEMKFTEEDLESMADKLLEQASANDIASQNETELPKPRKRSSKKKENTEPPKPPEQVLQELLDKGKKAGRLVMGLGLRELRRAGGNGEAVAKTYGALVERLVNKTQGRLNFLTIPEDMFPEARFEVAYLNDVVRGFAGLSPQKVSVWDFARHAAEFKEKQAERGKFARSLYNEDGSSTSLGNMLMALFLQECILREVKRG